MRELLHRHHFAVFNDSLAPTWFGHSGEHSRLDYIFGPVAWIDVLIKSAPLRRLGRRLQYIPDRELRDHVPVFAKIVYDKLATCADQCDDIPREKWNRDTLVHALRHGDRKHDYLTELNH
eukprot:2753706-Pyramimonas_sp.AAC.1